MLYTVVYRITRLTGCMCGLAWKVLAAWDEKVWSASKELIVSS
jgi:hypothetical protein